MALQSTTALATITLQAAASEVTFSGIPGFYSDLILSISGSSSVGAGLRMQFNNDTSSSYAYVYMQGGSSGTAASSGTTSWIDSYITTTQCLTTHEIVDYSSTVKHKSILTNRSVGGVDTMRLAQKWSSMTAVTSFKIYTSSGTFNSGVTISLYGRIS